MPTYGDCVGAAGDLDHVVRMVHDSHELRKCGVAEDGVVRQTDVRDIEVDVLGAVIFLAPEGEGKPGLA